jgi:signal peptidase I
LELLAMSALCLGLLYAVQGWVLKPFQIPSESMEPTLLVGDRVLVNRIAARMHAPRPGQVVVFYPPARAEAAPDRRCSRPGQGADSDQMCGAATDDAVARDTPYIKRLVAVGGDTISMAGGHLTRNGKRVAEPYARACTLPGICDFPRPITVPAGQFFLLGDNRGDSNDSRFWGSVSREQILGRAFVKFWPPSHVARL